MFGHIQANLNALNDEEKVRYQAVYCGLCHRLGELYGDTARLSLSYDMSFLVLLLSSLYEPGERKGECRCAAHPLKTHSYIINQFTDYAADMTVALSYFKCLDDWEDEGSLTGKVYAAVLKKGYLKVKEKWPRQCKAMEEELKFIAETQKLDEEEQADAAANSFGRLMAVIFDCSNDRWSEQLYKMGYNLGRFIYFVDAAIDLEQDKKSGSYNPLIPLRLSKEDIRTILKSYLAEGSEAFETLPLVQDVGILRSVVYSGVMMKFNEACVPESEREEK